MGFAGGIWFGDGMVFVFVIELECPAGFWSGWLVGAAWFAVGVFPLASSCCSFVCPSGCFEACAGFGVKDVGLDSEVAHCFPGACCCCVECGAGVGCAVCDESDDFEDVSWVSGEACYGSADDAGSVECAVWGDCAE